MNNTDTYTYTYRFYGDDGMLIIDDVMKMLRHGLKTVGGLEVESIQEHSRQMEGDITSDGVKAPYLDALEYRLTGGSSVMISLLAAEKENDPADEMTPRLTANPEAEPGSDPKADPRMEVTISVICADDDDAAATEARIRKDLESIIYMDHGMGYCCE